MWRIFSKLLHNKHTSIKSEFGTARPPVGRSWYWLAAINTWEEFALFKTPVSPNIPPHQAQGYMTHFHLFPVQQEQYSIISIGFSQLSHLPLYYLCYIQAQNYNYIRTLWINCFNNIFKALKFQNNHTLKSSNNVVITIL